MATFVTQPIIQYPTAWIKLHITLEDFGQDSPNVELKPLEHWPLELTITRNRWSEADTFEVVVDFEDFPLDPRILRGVAVEIMLDDAGSTDPFYWTNLSTNERGAKTRFLGVVDFVETEIDEDWRRTTLKGRDYTAYFLDTEIPKEPIFYGDKTFVEVIQAIVDERIQTDEGKIEVAPDPDVDLDLKVKHYKLRADDPKTGTRKKKHGEIIWEVLQEIALESGHILFVELDKIRIRKPSTIMVDQSLDEASFNRWTLGGNVKSFRPSRNLGRQHGIQVRVTSYNPDGDSDGGRKGLVSVHPKEDLEAERVEITPSAPGKDAQKAKPAPPVYTPYTVNGIRSQAQLDEIAKQLHELLRHHELEGEFETEDMVDSRGVSVLDLSYGDPVVFDVSESFKSILSLDRAAQIRKLIELNYPPDEASKIAISLNSSKVPFYFDKIVYRFDSGDDGGFSMEGHIRSRKQVNIGPAAAAEAAEGAA